tara:strand:- start:333 stop:470 length:138 start_codon:yes stop_codon:yes gene_type:complete
MLRLGLMLAQPSNKGELYDQVKHLLEKVQEHEATIAQLQEQLGSK